MRLCVGAALVDGALVLGDVEVSGLSREHGHLWIDPQRGMHALTPFRTMPQWQFVAAASGAVHISNSREGRAIFGYDALRPGASTAGDGTIGNDGTGRAVAWVRAHTEATDRIAVAPVAGAVSACWMLTAGSLLGQLAWSLSSRSVATIVEVARATLNALPVRTAAAASSASAARRNHIRDRSASSCARLNARR